MDKYQETFQTWNKIALAYEEQFMDLELYNDTYDWFCDSLERQEASILDIGCGPGNISRYLLKRNSKLKITGLDVAPKMVERAKNHLPNAAFHVMDCRELHLIKDKFEGIICGFTIPYVSPADCKKLFSDCYKLLSANGILYLSFVPGDMQQAKVLTGEHGERMYFYSHLVENIKGELESNGIIILKIYHKVYEKRDQSEEIHTIIISKRIDAQILSDVE